MNLTAWVFPGQGSQFVGMGRDLYENFPEAREVFAAADSVLDFNLSRLCFEGPEAELTDTLNAQPAILTHSIAALRVLQALLGDQLARPLFTAGHSLGEYSALVAAGAIQFEDGVRLVRARGRAMQEAGQRQPGAMAALLGLDDETVHSVCARAGRVQVANYNAAGQIVISGEKQALEQAVALAKQAGAKRAIPLAISIAAHSQLMDPAVQAYQAAVEGTPITPPELPVVSNITGQPLADVDEIRNEMLAQLTSPVQWVKSVRFMADCGVTEFYEIGPKDVLAGLIRRIAPEARAASVGTVANIKALVETTSPGG